MGIQGLGFLPCLWSVWTFLGLAVCYTLTLVQGHKTRYTIFISDTGNSYPESIVFAAVFFMSAIFGCVTVYIIYRFNAIRMAEPRRRFAIMQGILLAIGSISALMYMLTGIFSSRVDMTVHRASTAVGAILGCLYILSQAITLYWTSTGSRQSCHFRLGFAILTIVDLLIFGVTSCYVFVFRSKMLHNEVLYYTVIITEWVGIFLYQSFYFTMMADLQHLAFQSPKKWKDDWIIARERLQDSPESP
ncbi:DNA damage-regulated autophagy modulator protein 1-like [Hyperolius riggenbachi]|uniref:DNA damage-regulated autophagy modulator protein 1-like n=1 Tax=Hyperolius riggenbachi TaxID=752182 RepID=UPI0035A325C6